MDLFACPLMFKDITSCNYKKTNKKTTLLIAICWLIAASGSALCQPDTLWSVRFDMEFHDSVLLHYGSYAIRGSLYQNNTLFTQIARIDSVGGVIWEDTWRYTYSYDEMIETPDSGIAIIGHSGDSSNIKKYDMNGERLYSWNWSIDNGHNYSGLIADEDGGYISAGEINTSEETGWDVFLLKISADGEIEWNRVWVDWHHEHCYDLEPLPDGGFMILASNWYNESRYDIYVIRTDEEGREIWSNHYGLSCWTE